LILGKPVTLADENARFPQDQRGSGPNGLTSFAAKVVRLSGRVTCAFAAVRPDNLPAGEVVRLSGRLQRTGALGVLRGLQRTRGQQPSGVWRKQTGGICSSVIGLRLGLPFSGDPSRVHLHFRSGTRGVPAEHIGDQVRR
jgi:hypothetical protein